VKKVDTSQKLEERLKFSSSEDMKEYLDLLHAAEKWKWNILYPIKLGLERLIYHAKEWKNEFVWAFQRNT
jgi:hypothetical protein